MRILFDYLVPSSSNALASDVVCKRVVVSATTAASPTKRARRRFDAVKDEIDASSPTDLAALRRASADASEPLLRRVALCQLSSIDRWRRESPMRVREDRERHRLAIARASVAGRSYTRHASVRARRALERAHGYFRFDTRVRVDDRFGVFVATRRHDARVLFGVQLDDDPAGVFVWVPRRALRIVRSNRDALKRRLEAKRKLREGDKVRLTNDAEEAKRKLGSSPGWAEGMRSDLGKIGVVSNTGSSSRGRRDVVQVRFPSSSGQEWWLRTCLLARVSEEEAAAEATKEEDEDDDDGVTLKVGAYVRVCEDRGTAELVQGGCRAGWNPGMAPYCGRVGKILSEYRGEHIWRVAFPDGDSFAYALRARLGLSALVGARP